MDRASLLRSMKQEGLVSASSSQSQRSQSSDTAGTVKKSRVSGQKRKQPSRDSDADGKGSVNQRNSGDRRRFKKDGSNDRFRGKRAPLTKLPIPMKRRRVEQKDAGSSDRKSTYVKLKKHGIRFAMRSDKIDSDLDLSYNYITFLKQLGVPWFDQLLPSENLRRPEGDGKKGGPMMELKDEQSCVSDLDRPKIGLCFRKNRLFPKQHESDALKSSKPGGRYGTLMEIARKLYQQLCVLDKPKTDFQRHVLTQGTFKDRVLFWSQKVQMSPVTSLKSVDMMLESLRLRIKRETATIIPVLTQLLIGDGKSSDLRRLLPLERHLMLFHERMEMIRNNEKIEWVTQLDLAVAYFEHLLKKKYSEIIHCFDEYTSRSSVSISDGLTVGSGRVELLKRSSLSSLCKLLSNAPENEHYLLRLLLEKLKEKKHVKRSKKTRSGEKSGSFRDLSDMRKLMERKIHDAHKRGDLKKKRKLINRMHKHVSEEWINSKADTCYVTLVSKQLLLCLKKHPQMLESFLREVHYFLSLETTPPYAIYNVVHLLLLKLEMQYWKNNHHVNTEYCARLLCGIYMDLFRKCTHMLNWRLNINHSNDSGGSLSSFENDTVFKKLANIETKLSKMSKKKRKRYLKKNHGVMKAIQRKREMYESVPKIIGSLLKGILIVIPLTIVNIDLDVLSEDMNVVYQLAMCDGTQNSSAAAAAAVSGSDERTKTKQQHSSDSSSYVTPINISMLCLHFAFKIECIIQRVKKQRELTSTKITIISEDSDNNNSVGSKNDRLYSKSKEELRKDELMRGVNNNNNNNNDAKNDEYYETIGGTSITDKTPKRRKDLLNLVKDQAHHQQQQQQQQQQLQQECPPSDRFYDVLYSVLSREDLSRKMNQISYKMLINLCFSSMLLDRNQARLSALIKRLLQICVHTSRSVGGSGVICGILYMLCRFKMMRRDLDLKPLFFQLKSDNNTTHQISVLDFGLGRPHQMIGEMMNNQQSSKLLSKRQLKKDKQQRKKKLVKTSVFDYDIRTLNANNCGAVYTPCWELLFLQSHVQPAIREFSSDLLSLNGPRAFKGKTTLENYKGDPLQDFENRVMFEKFTRVLAHRSDEFKATIAYGDEFIQRANELKFALYTAGRRTKKQMYAKLRREQQLRQELEQKSKGEERKEAEEEGEKENDDDDADDDGDSDDNYEDIHGDIDFDSRKYDDDIGSDEEEEFIGRYIRENFGSELPDDSGADVVYDMSDYAQELAAKLGLDPDFSSSQSDTSSSSMMVGGTNEYSNTLDFDSLRFDEEGLKKKMGDSTQMKRMRKKKGDQGDDDDDGEEHSDEDDDDGIDEYVSSDDGEMDGSDVYGGYQEVDADAQMHEDFLQADEDMEFEQLRKAMQEYSGDEDELDGQFEFAQSSDEDGGEFTQFEDAGDSDFEGTSDLEAGMMSDDQDLMAGDSGDEAGDFFGEND